MTYKLRALRNCALVFFLGISTASAQSPSSSGAGSERWEFVASPYLMLPFMDGKTAVRGREVEVNAKPGDIFDNLQFGAMGYFGGRKGKWGFGIDALIQGRYRQWTALGLFAGGLTVYNPAVPQHRMVCLFGGCWLKLPCVESRTIGFVPKLDSTSCFRDLS